MASSINPDDSEKICREYNRVGGFLTTIDRLRSVILKNLSAEDLIARGLADKHVISEKERDHIISHNNSLESKRGALLDALMIKESRDATAFLDFLRETKQFKLAARIDAEWKEIERIVDTKVDAVSPTQYPLPMVSMASAETSVQANPSKPKPDIIGTEDGMVKIFRRNAWEAEPKREGSPLLKKKLRYVILSHTAQIGNFNTTEECLNAVHEAQQFNFSMGFGDIAFNYLVGNDGAIYEGRGHVFEGATARGWNHRAIGIAFIGKYVDKMPSEVALEALKTFLKYLKKEDVLEYDFTIHCLRQVRENFPEAPGDPLYNEIKTWRANDPEGWAWREKDDEEEDNTSSGEPLSNGSREKLRKKQTELMKDITSPLKLLDILGEKGVLRRYARKDMKRDNNGDDELKRAILNYITDKGTYHDVEKLMEALVELHQIFVANKMYKYFSPEEKKKIHIKQRRDRRYPPYKEIQRKKIQLSILHGNKQDPVFEQLGSGRYGKVTKATMDGLGNEPVAVKILNDINEKTVHEFRREAKIQLQLRHSSFVTIFGIVCEPHKYYWIVMEYMANGSLSDFLDKVIIPWPMKVRMMRDVARGLAYLHSPPEDERKYAVTHSDLKAANILVDENYLVKISDFGSAVENYVTSSAGVDHQFHKGGTLTHYAPELVRVEGKSYNPNEKSDMWSFGILIFEVCAENTRGKEDELRVPFHKNNPAIKISVDLGKNEWNPLTNNNSEQMKKIPLDECPQVLIDVMLHCCENDPRKRPKHFTNIAATLDDAYETTYKHNYRKSLAKLIIQHEELLCSKSHEQEPMDQDQQEEAMEQEEDRFELESVAPLFGDTLTN